MLEATLTLFNSQATCSFLRLSLARVRLRLRSSIVFRNSLTSPTASSFSSVICRVSRSICLTALLRSLKSAVRMGRSAALRCRESSLSCLRYSMPEVMLRQRFFSMVPLRLLMRREWRLAHFSINCSMGCSSPFGIYIISSSTSSGFDYFSKSRRWKMRLLDSSFNLFTLFQNFTRSQTILAKSSEKASADSENSLVLLEAFFTCDFFWRLYSQQSTHVAGLSSVVKNWCLLFSLLKFLSSIYTDWLLLSWVNMAWTSPNSS